MTDLHPIILHKHFGLEHLDFNGFLLIVHVGFEIFTVVAVKVRPTVLWDVSPSSLVEWSSLFVGTCCLVFILVTDLNIGIFLMNKLATISSVIPVVYIRTTVDQ